MEDMPRNIDSGGSDDLERGLVEEIVLPKGAIKKEKDEKGDNSKSSNSLEPNDLSLTDQVAAGAPCNERSEPDSKASSSTPKQQDDDQELESTRIEMGEVKEENQRLRMYLDRIMKDYRNLQMQFYEIMQHQQQHSDKHNNKVHQDTEESESFVSLSLGRSSTTDNRELNNIAKSSAAGQGTTKSSHDRDDINNKKRVIEENLSLGLDCKFEVLKSENVSGSTVRSFEEIKSNEEEAEETCPASKVLKSGEHDHDEVMHQNNVKKARVSVRARCDTPTMNDGCQWRKYGQKIAKGNPCPRAYYRCTVGPSCPVRKQVQRCADNMSILITTYEGTHNHPLPVSATAMASATSAAASILLSGSSSSISSTGTDGNTTPASLHGLNLYLSDNNLKFKPFYLHNSPFTSSSSPSYPTITLDLTSSTTPYKFASSYSNIPPIPKFAATTSLSFSTQTPSSSKPMPWNQNHLGGSTTNYPNLFDYYNMQQNGASNNQVDHSSPFAAATKAITSDPSFQSALAAALTTIIGNGGTVNNSENGGLKLKWGDQISAANGSGTVCTSNYLNRTSGTNSQSGGNAVFLQPTSLMSLASPNNASAITSPGDNKRAQANK